MLSAICFNLDQCNTLSSGNGLTPLEKQAFENIVGKGENAGNQHFLFFRNVFYTSQHEFQFLSHIYFVVCKCFPFGLV